RVDWDGRLLKDNFLISPDPDPGYGAAPGNQNYPTAAYNPKDNEYLVVWQDARNRSLPEIYGQRVSTDGTLKEINFLIATSDNGLLSPSLAYNQTENQYLVAWFDYRNGQQNKVYGQIVSNTGDLIGDNFPIAQGPGRQYKPVVAYNSTDNEYLVIWSDT